MEKLSLHEMIHHHGGIEYRFYPGCVECYITYADVACHETVNGIAMIPPEEIERYDREKYAQLAFEDASLKVPSEKELQAEYDKAYSTK